MTTDAVVTNSCRRVVRKLEMIKARICERTRHITAEELEACAEDLEAEADTLRSLGVEMANATRENA